MSELIKLFTNLVQIDSPSGDESAVADYVIQYLKDLGIEAQRFPSNNIYARIGSRSNPVLFCAHMDTVQPGIGIRVQEKNGYLVSDGNTILGGDNKASLAAILFTIKKLYEQKRDLNMELVFSVREETDSGIMEFPKNFFKSKSGFVFEDGTGRLDVVVKKSGTIATGNIEIFGKGAIVENPEAGVNALQVFLIAMQSLDIGRIDSNNFFNIGIFTGGSASNAIPAYMKLTVDLRSLDKDKFDLYQNNIEKVFKDAAKKCGAKVEINWRLDSQGFELETENSVFKKINQIYADHGIQLVAIEDNGGTDANYLNNIGINTYCLADGVEDSHSTQEKIKVEKFQKLQQLIENIILEFS